MNERDEVLKLLVSEQRAASANGHPALARLLGSLHDALRAPPGRSDALERARTEALRSLPPGVRAPPVVDRALALLRSGAANSREATDAERDPRAVPAAGEARTSGPRAQVTHASASPARPSGVRAPLAPGPGPTGAAPTGLARAPASRPVPAPGADPLAQFTAWLTGLIAKLKALLDGLRTPAQPPQAAPPRRAPQRKQPPPMPPEEKAFFDGLSAEERATYLALHHAQRELTRQGPQGRSRLAAPSESLEPGADASARLTAELFATLGEAADSPASRGPLRSVVLQTVANLLRETGGNPAAVKTRGLSSLLDQTEFSSLLLGHVEREITALPPSTRQGAQGYHEAFKRLRPELIDHARKLIYPGLTAPELVGALVDAVVESVDQQPRTGSRRGAGTRGKKVAFQGRFIRG